MYDKVLHRGKDASELMKWWNPIPRWAGSGTVRKGDIFIGEQYIGPNYSGNAEIEFFLRIVVDLNGNQVKTVNLFLDRELPHWFTVQSKEYLYGLKKI